MAHLLERDDLDEGDIGDLFDYLRGRSSLPDKRPSRCCECDGYVCLKPEEGDYVCMDCGLCQPGRVYYVEAWEDHERITVMPRDGYKPIHTAAGNRTAQFTLRRTLWRGAPGNDRWDQDYCTVPWRITGNWFTGNQAPATNPFFPPDKPRRQ